MPTPEITFRLLEKQDLPLLHQWLNNPHMRPYYQKEQVSLQEVTTKYLPRIEGSVPTFCHLATLEGKPIGKVQCYRNADWPEYASDIQLFEAVSMDYFIGEATCLKRGFGRRMIAAYTDEVVFGLFKSESECYVCHDATNSAAIRCSEAAGFKFMRHVTEKNIPSCLYRKSRIYAPLPRH